MEAKEEKGMGSSVTKKGGGPKRRVHKKEIRDQVVLLDLPGAI